MNASMQLVWWQRSVLVASGILVLSNASWAGDSKGMGQVPGSANPGEASLQKTTTEAHEPSDTAGHFESDRISALRKLWVREPGPGEQYNKIHPSFMPLDEHGEPIKASDIEAGRAKSVSFITTCGQCHDTEYINSRNTHWNKDTRVTCGECHLDGGKLDLTPGSLDEKGFLNRQEITIRKPDKYACGRCHGLVPNPGENVEIPEDYDRVDRYDLCKREGAVFSGGMVSESLVDMKAKQRFQRAWDVHAERGVGCVECHRTRNNLNVTCSGEDSPKHLLVEPRKPGLSEYLQKPDHRLVAASCTKCHDPFVVHRDLPYKRLHFEKLQCTACHSDTMLAPAYKVLDETVVQENGNPLAEYRGVREEPKDQGVMYYEPTETPLITLIDENGRPGCEPANVVSHFYWVQDNGRGEEKIPLDALSKAFSSGEGKGFDPEILKTFDKNGDSLLDRTELRLDTSEKVELIKNKLIHLGFKEPRIVARAEVFRVGHGVTKGKSVTMDCRSCHDSNSRVSRPLSLAGYLPFGTKLEWARAAIKRSMGDVELEGRSIDRAWKAEVVRSKPFGTIARADDGGYEFRKGERPISCYIFGLARGHLSDLFGMTLFLLTVLGVTVHGGIRFYSARKKQPRKVGPHCENVKKVYMYSLYERIWHWLMAASVILLLWTGFEIHYIADVQILGIKSSVLVHNVVAGILVLNALLALFYHITTNEIRQFIPPKETFLQEVVSQMKFYGYGIFAGLPHPIHLTRERKFNPLQQVTYFGLLNVLLPVQVVSGALLWLIGDNPGIFEGVGGIRYVALVHNFTAWLFLSFLVAHLYLITTGRTITSNLVAMVTGYEEIEEEQDGIQGK